jgi:hypothetical protein
MSLLYIFAASKTEGQPVDRIAANPHKPSSADDTSSPPSWRERLQGLTIADWRLPISTSPEQIENRPAAAGQPVDRNPEGLTNAD